jgi:NDP-hexose-3-ketoreductase
LSDFVQFGLIGFGRHVVKNILRCFGQDAGRSISRIYVRHAEKYRAAFPAFAERFTENLDDLLRDPAISVVYVATPIASHFEYAMAALRSGKSVWCEKPLTDRLERTEELVSVASQRGLMLAEVAMYKHHAQFAAIRELLGKKAAAAEALVEARGRFSIPQLDPADFRYSREAGGGALLDVGYYPLSMSGALFGGPEWVAAVGHPADVSTSDVDLSGSALLAYGTFGFHASWAIGSSYTNLVELTFERSRYVIAPAFSKPPTLATEIQAFSAAGQAEDPIRIEPDDQFMNLFNQLTALLRSRKPETLSALAQEIIQSAAIIETVRYELGRRSTI